MKQLKIIFVAVSLKECLDPMNVRNQVQNTILHHAVIKRETETMKENESERETTKPCLAFNPVFKIKKKLLTDSLLTGPFLLPVLYNDLSQLLIRKYTFVVDEKQPFLQICLHEQYYD